MDYIKLTMMISNTGLFDNKLPCQQIQFVDKLIERKQQLLEKSKMDPSPRTALTSYCGLS